MTDWIELKNIEVHTNIGVTPEEKSQKQKIHISVEFPSYATTIASDMDDLSLTTDYQAVYDTVIAVASQGERNLVETLAENVASELLQKFYLPEVVLSVKKYPFSQADYVCLKIHRHPPKPIENPETF